MTRHHPKQNPFPSNPNRELGQITTEWSLTFDPAQFVERYAPAIRKYLMALLKNQEDAEEVAQEFFLFVTKHGLPRARKERGRFRDYLKVTVRGSALNYLSRKKRGRLINVDLSHIPAPQENQPIPDQEWIVEWRQCLLDRAWQRLQEHQKQSPGNIAHLAMTLRVSHPQADSVELAAKASMAEGRVIRADAFRKQLSRARYAFAQFLVNEIAGTLDRPTPDEIVEELIDLGLMTFVSDFLPIKLKAPVS